MQSCTPTIPNAADDSGYLSHSGGSAMTNAVDNVCYHKNYWQNCAHTVTSSSLNDSGVAASPTIEIQQTLLLCDGFEDSCLSGISKLRDEVSGNFQSEEKSVTNNWNSINVFDSGISDLSSTSTKRKCNFSVCGNEKISSPKQNSCPKALATYFLSDSSAMKYCNANNSQRVSLAGRAHVDFLYELGERMDFYPIVSKIFSYLDPKDLCSVSMVSSTWHKVCCRDRIANRNRRQYIRCKKINLENTLFQNPVKITLGSRFNFTRGNGVLSQVQNLSTRPNSTSTPRSPPVSPTKVRFHLFRKEGEKLASGEHLTKCPRCSLPAHSNDSLRRGVCSRKGCQFVFCTNCQCEFHGVTPCRTVLLPKIKIGIVGSRRSRRNLRKLL